MKDDKDGIMGDETATEEPRLLNDPVPIDFGGDSPEGQFRRALWLTLQDTAEDLRPYSWNLKDANLDNIGAAVLTLTCAANALALAYFHGSTSRGFFLDMNYARWTNPEGEFSDYDYLGDCGFGTEYVGEDAEKTPEHWQRALNELRAGAIALREAHNKASKSRIKKGEERSGETVF